MTRQESEAHRRAEYDKARSDDPIRKLYKLKRWQDLRVSIYVERGGRCECGCGCLTVLYEREATDGCPVAVFDHVEGARERPGLFWDRKHIRLMAKPCHDRRTALDQGFARSTKWTPRPDWLMPSKVPVVLVCGPVAAGKTSYVKAHAGPYDLVLDLDEIVAEMSGVRDVAWDRDQWLGPAIRYRNAMLGKLSDDRCQWPKAWLISTEPTPKARQEWVDLLGCSVVVLATSAAECLRRVAADPHRAKAMERQAAGVREWWATYRPRDGDVVVGG